MRVATLMCFKLLATLECDERDERGDSGGVLRGEVP